MISLSKASLKDITDAAENAYPSECCGLLAGQTDELGNRLVTRVVLSPNLSLGDTRDSFEVDPKVRFRLMRDLEQAGNGEKIVGHYHSHPDCSSAPSSRDLAMAYEPSLVWVILAVHNGIVTETRAYMVTVDTSAFKEIPLRILDNFLYRAPKKSNHRPGA